MPSTKLRTTAAVVLSGAVLGGAAGAGTVALLDDGGTTTVVRQATAATTRASVAQTATSGLTANQIYARSSASVVHITAKGTSTSASPFAPQGSSESEATGTGFVVSTSGEIVTNAHVVDGASSITVKLADGTTRAARLVGKDESSDLALLRIDAGGLRLKALTLADSAKVEVGDATAAIGNPYGLDRTLTTGVVSAVHRTIEAPNGFSISDAIQTDAALNPGNSGGPLLDSSGRVVGVNSQIYTDSQSTGPSSSSGGNTGLGFAVPSNTVAKVLDALREGRTVAHAYLGVQVSDGGSGAGLAAVTAGGPAADAGLRAGDKIVAVDGRSVHGSAALMAAVDAHAPGDRVTVAVQRDGRRVELEVRLGTRPSEAGS